jgi:hypothetical protein
MAMCGAHGFRGGTLPFTKTGLPLLLSYALWIPKIPAA